MFGSAERGLSNLEDLFLQTPEVPLTAQTSMVFFSDLHMGNGGRTDDFLSNSELFKNVIETYYLERGHTLVLNGDIEELQRFRLTDILSTWNAVYQIFDRFRDDGRLLRLIGNHDLDLPHLDGHDFEIHDALRYSFDGHRILVFHGHQTAPGFEQYNRLVSLGLRYVANPLRITNFSVAHNSVKRFRTEQRAYQFAAAHQVLAIMGHTHRPLFESMAKVDSLKFEIERLCREYPKAPAKRKRSIEVAINDHKANLAQIRDEGDERASVASLYNAHLLIPCTFNSGTVIGRRGMTCLEIDSGTISLVHWFDALRSSRYLAYANLKQEALPGTTFHRVVLKSESLDYIFTRIKLLAGPNDRQTTEELSQ